MRSKSRQPLITRRTAFLLLGMAFSEAAIALTMVQIPVYLRELGASVEQVGFFFSVALVFPLLLRTFGGWLADAIGRVRSMSFGGVAGVLGFAAYALAPTWQAALLGSTLLALATALTIPAYYAYLADQTEEGTRGRVFGLAETVRTVALIVSPPLGGLLGQALGYRWMFAAASASHFVAATVFLTLSLTSSRMTKSSDRATSLSSMKKAFAEMGALFLSGGLVTWILIVDGVRDVAFKMSFDLMPVYLSDIAGLSKQAIGALDGIFGVALAVSIFPAGWLVDKTSERLAIVIGLITLISSRLVFALAGGPWGFAASWVLLGIGGGLLDPAGGSLISKSVPRRLRGLAYGLFATSLSVFSLPAPWVGSQIWHFFGPKAPFLLTAILGSLTVFPAWIKLVAPRIPVLASDEADERAEFEKITLFSVRAPELGTKGSTLRSSASRLRELTAASAEPPWVRAALTKGQTGATARVTLLLAKLKDPPGTGGSARTVRASPAKGNPLSRAASLITQRGGVINRLDDLSLMASFGFPPRSLSAKTSALLATHAAIDLLNFIARLNRSRAEDGRRALSLAIGIATGQVTLLPDGDGQSTPHAFFGDTVESALRLQQYAAAMRTGARPGGLLISEETFSALAAAKRQFSFGRHGPAQLSEASRLEMVYEILGREDTRG